MDVVFTVGAYDVLAMALRTFGVPLDDDSWMTAMTRALRRGVPDQIPKERYFDPDFYAMEAEQLWSRVWQMACRLEEIPGSVTSPSTRSWISRSSWCARGDRGGGRIRTPAATVASRSSRDAGRSSPGSSAPSTGGATASTGRTRSSPRRSRSPSTTCSRARSTWSRCAVRLWGGCAWINLNDDAPPLRELHRALRHRLRRLEGRVHAHRVVARLPASGELEAGRRGLLGAVPRDRDPSRAGDPQALRPQRPRRLRPGDLHRRRAALPPRDERGHGRHGPRQRRRGGRAPAHHDLSDDPEEAMATWHHTLNDAVVGWHTRTGATSPTSTSSRPRASTSRCATASRTTSCCPCTRAPPPTASAPSAPRRR